MIREAIVFPHLRLNPAVLRPPWARWSTSFSVLFCSYSIKRRGARSAKKYGAEAGSRRQGLGRPSAFARKHPHHEPPTPELESPWPAPSTCQPRSRKYAVGNRTPSLSRLSGVTPGYRLFGSEGPLMGRTLATVGILVRAPQCPSLPADASNNGNDCERTPQLVGVAYTTYRRPTDSIHEDFAGSRTITDVHDVG